MDTTELVVAVLKLMSQATQRNVQVLSVYFGDVVGISIQMGDSHLLEALTKGEDLEYIVLAEIRDAYTSTRSANHQPRTFEYPQSLTNWSSGDT